MASSSAFLTGTLRCKDRESAPSPKSHFAFGSMPVSSSSVEDRKSTRLNSSHSQIPYAVSCLKKNDIHLAHAPAFHFQSRWFVQINRIGADHSGAVVINHVLLGGLHDFEAGSEREARPIRRTA